MVAQAIGKSEVQGASQDVEQGGKASTNAARAKSLCPDRMIGILALVVGTVGVTLAVVLLATRSEDDNSGVLAASGWLPKEPPVSGVMPGTARPKLILAQDIDWPPYAYLGVPPESDYGIAGFGHDIAHGLGALCDIDVTTVQTDWENCWNAGKIGAGLLNGHYHACMTYTHTKGERNRFMEFSWGILKANKPAGLLTRLDSNGQPVINGRSNLNGVKVVDVVGWAPTSDTLALVENQCTRARFADFEMISPVVPEGENPNDVALRMLLSGGADAMWVYADQAQNYQCTAGITSDWDCDLWAKWKTEFAYIQTGLDGHTNNGTTLAMAKKGSGLMDVVNPCLQRFMDTKEYYDICKKHQFETSCYPNGHFPDGSTEDKDHEKPTDQLTTSCSQGYCKCPAA